MITGTIHQLQAVISAMNTAGYLHPMYAQSLAEYGIPIELPTSQGWILKRPVPGTKVFDGMGCYPIFSCQNWSALEMDIEGIASQLVCLSLITDPFGRYNQQDLLKIFIDVVKPYKKHFVIDLRQTPRNFVVAHHQRNVHKALRMVTVEVCVEPIKYLNDWISLYNDLIERHHISGMTKFSAKTFAKQLSVPGVVAFRAHVNEKTIGILLWYVQGTTGYYHLGAYSSEGYKLKASFALFWSALDYFANTGLEWLSLGAGAGTQVNVNDGLTRFKQGWSTGVKTVYLCGRIFDRKKYQEIIETKNIPHTNFFPAYRLGEF
jgi:hypothetical protein